MVLRHKCVEPKCNDEAEASGNALRCRLPAPGATGVLRGHSSVHAIHVFLDWMVSSPSLLPRQSLRGVESPCCSDLFGFSLPFMRLTANRRGASGTVAFQLASGLLEGCFTSHGSYGAMSMRAAPADFLSVDLDEEEEDEGSDGDEVVDVPPREVAQALQLDWQHSDLSLESEKLPRRGTILRQGDLFPGCWGLARGLRGSYQGRHVWHVKILKLPRRDQADLLFGISVHWPSCSSMPGAGVEEPAMILLANTGDQIFTSSSGKLLRSPLCAALAAGEVIAVIADLHGRRLQFRRGGQSVEAKPLPVRKDSSGRGSHSSNRLRETAYFPFIALQPGVEVELLDSLSPLPEAPGHQEAVILAGPPRSGKTTWASRYQESHHVLNAEWLEHRANFLDLELSEGPLNSEARRRLALRLLAAFSDPPLARAVPELLRRAAQRGVSVVADDCHLSSCARAALRAALLHFPGPVRWEVVLPKTLEELLARQGQQAEAWRQEWASSTLPEEHVDFVLGQREVFRRWLGHEALEAPVKRQKSGVQGFFRSFGDPGCFLSTEGTRRY